jgi:hypothetical protein
MAAMAPWPGGTASCMARPRALTARTASAKERFRRPRGPTTRPASARRPAPAQRRAGPARAGGYADRQNGRLGVFGELEVFRRPLEDQLGEREAEGLVGLGKGLAATGKRSASSRPMPTACEPCPGKRKAIFLDISREILPEGPGRMGRKCSCFSSSASCRRGRRRSAAVAVEADGAALERM